MAPNSVAKGFIMSFYDRLKAFDEDRGKHLTYNSFGNQPESEQNVYFLCDHAIMLFCNEEIQKLSNQMRQQYKESAQKLLDENAPFETFKQLAMKFVDKHEDMISKNALPPIGFADLFRFQFVNFVDKITFCEKDEAQYDCVNHEIQICKFVDEKSKSENPEFFWRQNIVAWHELVHLLQTKSYHNGNNKFVTPFQVEGESYFFLMDGKITNRKVLENGEVSYNEKPLDAFKQGVWILNEALTEKMTLRLWQKQTLFALNENNYGESPILANVFSDEENNFSWFSTYLKFVPIIEVLDAFYEKKYHILASPDFPATWSVWNEFEDLFKAGSLSEKVFKAVHENLAELGVDDKNTNNLFHKFLIILGRAKLEYVEKKDKYPYNSHFRLAQTMFLDAALNKVKEELKLNPKASMKNADFVTTLLKRHKLLHAWLVLPNKNLGTEENPVWAKSALCPSELSKIYPDNLLLEVLASATEKMFEAVNNFCPEKIEESFLMKNTQEYLKKTKEINPEK